MNYISQYFAVMDVPQLTLRDIIFDLIKRRRKLGFEVGHRSNSPGRQSNKKWVYESLETTLFNDGYVDKKQAAEIASKFLEIVQVYVNDDHVNLALKVNDAIHSGDYFNMHTLTYQVEQMHSEFGISQFPVVCGEYIEQNLITWLQHRPCLDVTKKVGDLLITIRLFGYSISQQNEYKGAIYIQSPKFNNKPRFQVIKWFVS